MSKKSSAHIGLFVYEQQQDGYYHVKAYPVSIGLTEKEQQAIDRNAPYGTGEGVNSDTVRNISGSYGELQNGLYLADLHVYSQGGTISDHGKRELYAWELQYSTSHVRLDEAVKMAKTLTTVNKRMAKIATDYGRPTTFGQYLLHVAKSIGATSFVFNRRKGASDYSAMDKRIVELSTGVDTVDYAVRHWVEEGTLGNSF